MKNTCFLLLIKVGIFFLLLSQALQGFSQKKLDNIWMMGENNLNKTSMFSFSDSKLHIDSSTWVFPLEIANASICNDKGELLFFTNAYKVANQKFEIMEGGSKLIPANIVTNQYINTGMPDIQFCMALPYVADTNKYYLLYSDLDLVQFPDKKYSYTAYNSLFSTIDFTENLNGKVRDVDSVIFSDTLTSGQIAACRHGNGQDWWVILPGNQNFINHTLLIDHGGINYIRKQEIGSKNDKLFGQSFFTPDGKKFIRVSIKRIGKPSGIDIYDFDRCSGILYNYKKIVLEDSLSVYACGGAVSSNSQFLYVSYRNFIFQYDLLANDIASTKDTVAIYDKFIDPATGFPIGFFLAQLAPDGKIYINTSNSTAWIHVIDQPNEKGKACNVIQHAFKLPTFNGFTMPNFPHYRLGSLKGSPCDSIVANKEITEEDYHIKVFPNPATTELKIDITLPQYDPQTPTEIRLISAAGAVVKTYSMPDYAYLATLDISYLESGFYEVQLRQKGKTMAVEKVVIVR